MAGPTHSPVVTNPLYGTTHFTPMPVLTSIPGQAKPIIMGSLTKGGVIPTEHAVIGNAKIISASR